MIALRAAGPAPRPLRPALASTARRGAAAPAPEPPRRAPVADELAAIAVDLAQVAVRLAETTDALLAATGEERAALRVTLHHWQTVLRLGARRLNHAATTR